MALHERIRQIMINTATESDPVLLSTPIYIRIEGTIGAAGCTLKSCLEKDFTSRETQIEKTFTATDKSYIIEGKTGVYVRVEAPDSGVEAFWSAARTVKEGHII